MISLVHNHMFEWGNDSRLFSQHSETGLEKLALITMKPKRLDIYFCQSTKIFFEQLIIHHRNCTDYLKSQYKNIEPMFRSSVNEIFVSNATTTLLTSESSNSPIEYNCPTCNFRAISETRPSTSLQFSVTLQILDTKLPRRSILKNIQHQF